MATITIPWNNGTKTIKLTQRMYLYEVIKHCTEDVVLQMAHANPPYFKPTDTYETVCIKEFCNKIHFKGVRSKINTILKTHPIPDDLLEYITIAKKKIFMSSSLYFWYKKGVITPNNFDCTITLDSPISFNQYIKAHHPHKSEKYARRYSNLLYKHQAYGFITKYHKEAPYNSFKWNKKRHTWYTKTIRQNVRLLFMIYKNNDHCEKIAL